MRNITRPYVAKSISMIFYYAAKGLTNVTKSTINILLEIWVVTFKLNVAKYISLKANYIIVKEIKEKKEKKCNQ